MRRILSLVLLAALLLGCQSTTRIKGGSLSYQSGKAAITQVQGQDAKTPSKLDIATHTSTEVVIPAGSTITLDTPVTSKDVAVSNAPVAVITLSSNTTLKQLTEETFKSSVGGAQKNDAAETIAKLGSFRPMQFVGVAILLFGIASLFHPWLRALIQSVSTSIVFCFTGLFLTVAPLLIIGYELPILLGGLAVCVAYLLVYRYGASKSARAA